MPRHRPLLSENEERAEANRQTSGLVGVAVVLLLLVVGLFLIHTLHDAARVEDCLMAGRLNCDRLVLKAH
jgi:hypothetical protein